MHESFAIVHLILIGTSLITFIEALRTTSSKIRHILNLETTVSLIAGIVYGMFLEMTKSPTFSLDQVTKLRYVDWAITTPMLLLVLALFFDYDSPTPLNLLMYVVVVLLNYGMLLSGYLGETKQIRKDYAVVAGFACLLAMFVIIWLFFLHDHKLVSIGVFIAFCVIWSMYGVAYMMNEIQKNTMYNILDVISKVFFGIFMWMHYGGVFQ